MGNCCSAPKSSDDRLIAHAKPLEVESVVHRSISFIHGVKVTPSAAAVTSSGDISDHPHLRIRVENDGQLFFAAMFTGFNIVPSPGSVVPNHAASSAAVSMCYNDCWTELQAAMYRKHGDLEDALRDMFSALHIKLGNMQQQSSKHRRAASHEYWATGVAIVGDLQSKVLTVASVGTCHATMCQMVGSFGHQKGHGIALIPDPVTASEQAAFGVKQKTGGSKRFSEDAPIITKHTAALAGITKDAAHIDPKLLVKKLRTALFDTSAQEAARGHVLGLLQPPTQLGESAGNTALGVVDSHTNTHNKRVVSVRDVNVELNVGSDRASKGSAGSSRASSGSAKQQQPAPFRLPELETVVSYHSLTPQSRFIMLMTDSIAGVLSDTDAACIAQHFNPSHVQLLRNAIVEAQLHPKVRNPMGATPVKRVVNSANAASDSPGRGAGVVAGDYASAAKSGTPRRSSQIPNVSMSISSSTQNVPTSRTGGSATPGRVAAAVSDAQGSPSVASLDPEQATPEAPRFNLASLLLHHARQKTADIRQHRLASRKKRESHRLLGGIWHPTSRGPSRNGAAAAGVSLASNPLASHVAPNSTATTAGEQQKEALGGGAALPAPLGEDSPAGLLVLTLDWPLSVTSQNVQMMRRVAAARAEHPAAECRWHMVRQYVRHMNARRKRIHSSWSDVIKWTHSQMDTRKREQEIRAWKERQEVVQLVSTTASANTNTNKIIGGSKRATAGPLPGPASASNKQSPRPPVLPRTTVSSSGVASAPRSAPTHMTSPPSRGVSANGITAAGSNRNAGPVSAPPHAMRAEDNKSTVVSPRNIPTHTPMDYAVHAARSGSAKAVSSKPWSNAYSAHQGPRLSSPGSNTTTPNRGVSRIAVGSRAGSAIPSPRVSNAGSVGAAAAARTSPRDVTKGNATYTSPRIPGGISGNISYGKSTPQVHIPSNLSPASSPGRSPSDVRYARSQPGSPRSAAGSNATHRNVFGGGGHGRSMTQRHQQQHSQHDGVTDCVSPSLTTPRSGRIPGVYQALASSTESITSAAPAVVAHRNAGASQPGHGHVVVESNSSSTANTPAPGSKTMSRNVTSDGRVHPSPTSGSRIPTSPNITDGGGPVRSGPAAYPFHSVQAPPTATTTAVSTTTAMSKARGAAGATHDGTPHQGDAFTPGRESGCNSSRSASSLVGGAYGPSALFAQSAGTQSDLDFALSLRNGIRPASSSGSRSGRHTPSPPPPAVRNTGGSHIASSAAASRGRVSGGAAGSLRNPTKSGPAVNTKPSTGQRNAYRSTGGGISADPAAGDSGQRLQPSMSTGSTGSRTSAGGKVVNNKASRIDKYSLRSNRPSVG